MQIISYSLGELQTNCYLLIQENECLLIDPADDASFILEEIQRRNLTLEGILATHGHFDHVMSVGEIQSSINVPFYIHKKDEFLIKRLGQTAKHFLGYEPVVIPPKNIKYFSGKTLHVKRFTLHVIETPGHTPGGCCFYFDLEQAVFTGDTVFKNAVGRTDLSYSNSQDLNTSIYRLIELLPEETIVYPGHGDRTTIMDEKVNLV
ncbi:MBL fold metallo-hydrolase [Candidatus Roizmanbacteria bacterium CG_4_10_14_0_8_um_filter_33_9]|uniref:MBL fold metallo-hydrolase n=1 Tax=Candidatus Roizmanbacteria bacterium CG_4_10_14_0_8_um_filter_33_9 TaxID=1974826 RepID=A0A2M7QJG6_9BACT|nr:MAG: MBL fold metallo-hydrolase [Candidatus Roizmanbacteria bacterium CG_4_10_14_0_8_um_filter_33_9]